MAASVKRKGNPVFSRRRTGNRLYREAASATEQWLNVSGPTQRGQRLWPRPVPDMTHRNRRQPRAGLYRGLGLANRTLACCTCVRMTAWHWSAPIGLPILLYWCDLSAPLVAGCTCGRFCEAEGEPGFLEGTHGGLGFIVKWHLPHSNGSTCVGQRSAASGLGHGQCPT